MSTASAATTSFSKATAHSMGFCSTSSTSSPFSGPVHVDEDGFLQSSLRAGGPHLCSLPARTHSLSPAPSNDTMREIERFTSRILRDLHLRYNDIAVTGRQSKIDPEPELVATVLVRMPNHSQPELWHRAVRLISADLERRGHRRMSVELIEHDFWRGTYCFPVERHNSIFPKWQDIVQEILRRSRKIEWTGIDCWRYGTNPRRRDNPVTVIVRVLKSSQNSFTTAARLIHGILATFKEADVDVLFMKDAQKSFVMNPTLPLGVADGSVHPGVSIGIHNSSAGSSTLGGLVQIRFKREKKWSTYGLTCFHCVCPPAQYHGDAYLQNDDAKKALERWVDHPLTMQGNDFYLGVAQRILRIDHPSVKDLKQTVKSLNEDRREIRTKRFWECKEQVDKGEDGWLPRSQRALYHHWLGQVHEIEERRAPFQKMLDNGSYYLGHVVAGTGMNRTRVNKDGLRVSVDWALIKISNNRIYKQTHGENVSGNEPFPYERDQMSLQFHHDPDLELKEGLKLRKSGRSTGSTASVFNELQSVELLRLNSRKGPGYQLTISWVTKIPKMDYSFAEPGDSGSWIYSAGGAVLGMLTGGDERQETISLCRMQDIFNDIKDLTGAADVQIVPPPDS